MAGIASKPMAIFRRPESPKPLHARWGDVAISVPTDGSWNQYDNPHRPPPERQSYGPGFVPDCSPSDRGHDALGSNSTKERPAMTRDEDNKSPSMDRAAGISRRNSLSLGGLRPTRLSVRLASRPKHLRGESSLERASHYAEHRKPEFAYKPIHQDYPAEISEKTERPPHRYRYIPTNGRYLEDIPSPRSPRSQSASSFRGSHSRRDSFTESLESQERERERERGREQARLNSRQSYYPEDDRQSVRSSIAGSSDGSGAGSRLSFGLPPRRRTSPFVAADRKRSSSLKPMTLAMVPDPEDLYE